MGHPIVTVGGFIEESFETLLDVRSSTRLLDVPKPIETTCFPWNTEHGNNFDL